jgi:hypothetical protein
MSDGYAGPGQVPEDAPVFVEPESPAAAAATPDTPDTADISDVPTIDE